jgi:DNA invertase Pin-like site-specific DNA recombinase
MPVRAALYARVSSVAQRDRQTIESQLRTLPEYAKAQGWQVVGSYVDDGKSAKAGKLDARDGFAGLMADAAAGRFDVVVVVALDRLTRSEDRLEREMILGGLERAGVKIALVGAGIQDPRTFSGDVMISLQAVFAAEENRKRRERTVAGKLTAIARGRKPSGPTPYGYRFDREAGWSLDPVAAPIVVEMFERVAAGESCEAVARDLERRGVARVRDGRWIRERVWQTVRARTYVGEWTADRGRKLVVPVPPIVTADLYLRAQDEMISHGKRGLDRTMHVYLLAKLAKCGICGEPIGIAASNGHGPSKYICKHRRRPIVDTAPCKLPLHSTADVDREMWATIVDVLGREDLIADMLRRRRAAGDEAPMWERDLAAARDHLARLDRTEAAVLARFQRGAVTEAGMDVALDNLTRERDGVRRQAAAAEQALSRAGAAVDKVEALEERLAAIRGALPGLAPAERRDLARALLEPGSVVLGTTVASARLLLAPPPAAGVLVQGGSTSYAAPGVGFRVALRLVRKAS